MALFKPHPVDSETLVTDISLRVSEIFYSLQGESSWVGLPTVFVRLTGCPLRCSYCDTPYSFSGGSVKLLSELVNEIETHNTEYICVTGGEPLAQKNCIKLLTLLCDKGYKVSLETSGSLDIADVDPRVKRVVDLKTPSSKESDKNRFENIPLLVPLDEIKFVVCNREDYLWSVNIIHQYRLYDRVDNILFSPVFEVDGVIQRQDDFNEQVLAQWILDSRLPVRMQMQLHKLIWGDESGR
tara:strand:- start:1319 stop:2038 length:720 start_codon:yes stop_codon:yes gene_type:complete